MKFRQINGAEVAMQLILHDRRPREHARSARSLIWRASVRTAMCVSGAASSAGSDGRFAA